MLRKGEAGKLISYVVNSPKRRKDRRKTQEEARHRESIYPLPEAVEREGILSGKTGWTPVRQNLHPKMSEGGGGSGKGHCVEVG